MITEESLYIITAVLSLTGLFGSWFYNYTCSNPQHLNKPRTIIFGILIFLMVLTSFTMTMLSHRENKARLKVDREEMDKRIMALQSSSNETNLSLHKALSALDALSRNPGISKTFAKYPNSRKQINGVVQDKYITSLAAHDKSIADTLLRIRSKVTDDGMFSETPPLASSPVSTTGGFTETPPVVSTPTKDSGEFVETPPILRTPRGRRQ